VERVDNFLRYVIGTLGMTVSDIAPRPSPGGWPHLFTVSSLNVKKRGTFWAPFVCSNYERGGQGAAGDSAAPLEVGVEVDVEAAGGDSGGGSRDSLEGNSSQKFVHLGRSDCPLLGMMRSTSAAPTFFPPYFDEDGNEHVDGAIVQNNPSGVALKEAAALWPGRRVGCLVSLGTGKHVEAPKTASGPLYWLGSLLSLPMQVHVTHMEVKATIQSQPPHKAGPPLYARFDPPTGDFALDEHMPQRLRAMQSITTQYCQRKAAKINRTALTLLMLSDRSIYRMVQHCGGFGVLSDEMVRELLIDCGGDPDPPPNGH